MAFCFRKKYNIINIEIESPLGRFNLLSEFMNFQVITIFPKIFDSYLDESIMKRASEQGVVNIAVHDLRKWTNDRHRSVDDKPFGGGAGMVMKAEPIIRALEEISVNRGEKKRKVILLSAKGKLWNQKKAEKYSKLEEIVLICGRYEGVDERIVKFVDEEISVGEYVLTGGELPALTIIDSITRLIPGVLGNIESPAEESYSKEGMLEYPQYTRPEKIVHKGSIYSVPKVLLSGDHKKIREWRAKKMKKN